MSHTIKVKAQPGHALRFPEICVHCSRPASERMSIKKRRGGNTRLIDVPICSNCARELKLKSGEEERWQRLGLIATAGIGFIIFIAGILLLTGLLPLWLRLIIALLVASLAAAGVWELFKHKSLAEARPQKKAILQSARMVYFSWRATTFEFENETFASCFKKLNEPGLMEV
jgi:hypothetical protein